MFSHILLGDFVWSVVSFLSSYYQGTPACYFYACVLFLLVTLSSPPIFKQISHFQTVQGALAWFVLSIYSPAGIRRIFTFRLYWPHQPCRMVFFRYSLVRCFVAASALSTVSFFMPTKQSYFSGIVLPLVCLFFHSSLHWWPWWSISLCSLISICSSFPSSD